MIRKIICINAVIVILLALVFCIYPAARAGLDLRDPALPQPGIPKIAWRIHRNITPRYAAWARQRLAGGEARKLSTDNIPGTEWTLFGSVFYLWSVENLQSAWQAGDHTAGVEPAVFSREAVVAASELVIDPGQAGWVQKHWGTNYLHHENVFYRMLIIAALTSRENLLRDGAHTNLLRDQVESLASELDASKTGLLDDYPGRCFPGDVMAAIACIHRADAVLGTDHSVFVNRSLRGFIGARATRHPLPPYQANASTGLPVSPDRGCANSYICLTAPELWPGEARQWFQKYDEFFWQQRFGIAGYREFPKDLPGRSWMWDVDAGPVIAGYGVAANAFGVGAARRNGRFDRAYPLAAEMLATAWELPNGTLAVPRLLSDLSDAPMLGETAILWQLTIQPEKGFPSKTGGTVPPYVYVVLIGALLFGAWRILESIWTIREARRELQPPEFRLAGPQAALWCLLMAGVLWTIWSHRWLIGFCLLLAALLLPRCKKRPVDDWDTKAVAEKQKRGAAPKSE